MTRKGEKAQLPACLHAKIPADEVIGRSTEDTIVAEQGPAAAEQHALTTSEAPDISPAPALFYTTTQGRIFCGDSLQLLRNRKLFKPGSVNLIVTSPPFGLVRKKEYGNVPADEYVEWFRPFAREFYRLLADNGSLVIDIGGAWIEGQPTRSLYHYELLIMLCRKLFPDKARQFHLAEEFFWWNPSKLPTPAEWVTVRRIRVKDAMNYVWWLSKTPWPKADNRRVLQPYSDSMKELLEKGYKAQLRPSGHDISEKFNIDNGASIPPNLLAIANTESNSYYLRYCAEHKLDPHPARYPATLPEFFIRMLTDPGDLVIDPFAGSCVTGEVAERLGRRWVCSELRADYLEGALGRFVIEPTQTVVQPKLLENGNGHAPQDMDAVPEPVQIDENSDKLYKLPRPGLLWNGKADPPLASDGGKVRVVKTKEPKTLPATEAMEEEATNAK